MQLMVPLDQNIGEVVMYDSEIAYELVLDSNNTLNNNINKNALDSKYFSLLLPFPFLFLLSYYIYPLIFSIIF